METTQRPVFTNRKSLDAGGGIEIKNPTYGREGWRKTESGGWEEVFFDAKAKEPAWVSRAEFESAKAERSRLWKKTKGPADWRMKHQGAGDRYLRGPGGCYMLS